MSLAGFTGASRSRTAHEYVRDSLRRAILSGSLRPGTHLVQTEVATQLEVSTTPVREALRDLATEGLVFFDPHRGALVRTLDLGEVREIYQLRAALEPLVVPRVIDKIRPETFERAEQLTRALDRERDPSRWVEVNREFHSLFTDFDQGSRLEGILRGLRDSAATYVSLSLAARPKQMSEANEEHRAVIDAYRRRDAEAVVEITVAHLESTLRAIEEAYRTDAP